MAIRDIFKLSRKTFLNPVGWIDFNAIKEQNRTIWDVLRNLFTAPQPVREETFEEAVDRLELTRSDLARTGKNYRTFAIIFAVLGLLAFIYAFYLLFSIVSITGWILGLATSALFFAQAFRFDFWAFQIKKRKLGVTFTEWKHSILGEKETSK